MLLQRNEILYWKNFIGATIMIVDTLIMTPNAMAKIVDIMNIVVHSTIKIFDAMNKFVEAICGIPDPLSISEEVLH